MLLILWALCGACSSADHPTTHEEQDAASGEPEEAGSDDEPSEIDASASTHEEDAGTMTTRDASARDAGATPGNDAGATGPKVDRANPQLFEFSLDPHQLDPTTADSLSVQYAQLDTRTAPLGQLVIFLPGANNVPRDWRDHGRKLAEFGFHVLIPHYNNRWSSTGNICMGMPSNCADDTRWEALSGEDSSAAITIARADSAEGRVVTMLKHLITAHPAGDWGYYLAKDDQLRYAAIVIAGISHGAASAGMYAARRPCARNVMHSSGPAGSTSGTKMTPLSAWYAFAHTADDAYSAIIMAWDRFMLPGQVVNIDGKTPPFDSTHRLSTSAMSSYPHGSTCVHSSSPKDSAGKYLFEDAWRYLYGVPAR
jgi:dienelactone hydrolase